MINNTNVNGNRIRDILSTRLALAFPRGSVIQVDLEIDGAL